MLFIHTVFFVFCKQKTADEMRISDWSSDVCSSDLPPAGPCPAKNRRPVCCGNSGAGRSRSHARHGLYPGHTTHPGPVAQATPEPAVLGHVLRRNTRFVQGCTE